MSSNGNSQYAIVTGASSGIGYQLAKLCAQGGYDLLIAADTPSIVDVAAELRTYGVSVQALEVDLATEKGLRELCDAAKGRPVDALLANAGHGLGGGFLNQELAEARHVLDTNVTGTIYLLHEIGRRMRTRGSGRILITGSIAGFVPGAYQAVYNATKAFIGSFALALRAELVESGVTVTCLLPGATDTDFFARAGLLDTKLGQEPKADPADVARVGFEAMLRGEGDVVAGWKNRLEVAVANLTPAEVLAERHKKLAEPGSAVTE
jgi:short-subunit dehydrogenase